MVSDASPLPPIRKDAAPGEESGRGLMLVEELSERWGWTPHRDGKTCWFLLELTGRADLEVPGHETPERLLKRMPTAARNSGMTAECSARPTDA